MLARKSTSLSPGPTGHHPKLEKSGRPERKHDQGAQDHGEQKSNRKWEVTREH